MSFYVTGGTLQGDARSYVERAADRQLFEMLLRGEFCYVLTSRQMGKSSLMVRAAARLRERGLRVAALDLTAVGGRELSPEQWYYGMLDMLGEQLRMEVELEKFWRTNGELGPLQRLMKAIRQVVLPRLAERSREGETGAEAGVREGLSSRLVLFVDEIDVVRSLPFSTDDFFAGIRECYNRRTQEPLYERLTFCLLGVASPSDLIQDERTTPFNIGQRIELDDFTAVEALPLAAGLEGPGMDRDLASVCMDRILHWSGGHPYLTQRLGRETAQTLATLGDSGRATANWNSEGVTRLVDRVCSDVFFAHRARDRDDNLVFVRERLLRSGTDVASLLDLYLQVRRGRWVPDDDLDPLVVQLRLAGIVRGVEGRLEERNRIYGRVFDPEWVRSHMPQAELRRQRRAWWRGVLWAAGVSALVAAGVGAMARMAWEKDRKARLATIQAELAQAREVRTSGSVGQRTESLRAIGRAARLEREGVWLVNEAVESLALPDLEEDRDFWGDPEGSWPILLPPMFDVEAEWDAAGRINIREVESGVVRMVLPGLGSPVLRIELDNRHRYGVVEYADVEGDAGPFLGVWDCATGRLLGRLSQGIPGRSIDFSRNGRWLALGRADGTIGLYELGTGKIREARRIQLSAGPGPLNARVPDVIRFHPRFGLETGSEVLAESSSGSTVIHVWDLAGLEAGGNVENTLGGDRRYLRFSGAIQDFCWNPSGLLLAAACDHNNVEVLFPEEEKPDRGRMTLVGHDAAVKAVAFNHRGDSLASLGADGRILFWSLASDRVLSLSIPVEEADRLWFQQDDHRLLAGRADGRVWRAWRVLGGEYRVLSRHHLVGRGIRNPVWDIDYLDISPDSHWLIAGSSASLTLWRVSKGHRMADLEIEAPGRGAAFGAQSRGVWLSSDTGLWAYSLETDSGSIARLDRLSPEPVPGVPSDLGSLVLTEDRKRAAITRWDTVLLVDLEEGTQAVVSTGTHLRQLALSPDGFWIAGRSRGDEGLRVWEVASRTEVSPPAPILGSDHFGFSPDSRWLVVFSEREMAWQFYGVATWTAEPGGRIETGHPTAAHPGPFAISPDGGLLAVVLARSLIGLYDLMDGGPAGPLSVIRLDSPDPRRLLRLHFSPDSRYVVAVAQDQTLQVWDLHLLRSGLERLGLDKGFPGRRSR
jgi:WD40 repeat protein